MVTVPLDADVLVLAPLALIIGVTALWLLQLVIIDLEKRMLGKLRHQHEALARFTNFTGVLFQGLSHALGYTVTHSGVAHFKVTVNYSKVEPKREKQGVFAWTSTLLLYLGPFLLPTGIMLLYGYFVLTRGFSFPASVQYSFVQTLTNFGGTLSTFAQSMGRFLVSMDLLNPVHILFLLILLFLGLGIRPSYIGEERKEKINFLYDLKNITMHFIKKPVYILVFFAVVYGLFLLSLALNANWYVLLFSVLGLFSVIGIIALLLGFLLLALVWATDNIAPGWRFVPFLTLPLSYGTIRVLFFYFPWDNILGWSLFVMILATIVVTVLLMKYKKTNRFKTVGRMKHTRVADGKKRASQK
jgi:hypothetical protein